MVVYVNIAILYWRMTITDKAQERNKKHQITYVKTTSTIHTTGLVARYMTITDDENKWKEPEDLGIQKDLIQLEFINVYLSVANNGLAILYAS